MCRASAFAGPDFRADGWSGGRLLTQPRAALPRLDPVLQACVLVAAVTPAMVARIGLTALRGC